MALVFQGVQASSSVSDAMLCVTDQEQARVASFLSTKHNKKRLVSTSRFLLCFSPLEQASHHLIHLTAEANSAYDNPSLRIDALLGAPARRLV